MRETIGESQCNYVASLILYASVTSYKCHLMGELMTLLSYLFADRILLSGTDVKGVFSHH
jgi:hypothetical protein